MQLLYDHRMILLVTSLLLWQAPEAQTSEAQERFPSPAQQDARHYDMQLHVDMEKRELRGHVDYTFAAVKPLEQIRLDAQRSDKWLVAFQDDSGSTLQTEWHNDHVFVKLPKRAPADSLVKFRATLQGRPVDGFYFKKNRYGDLMAFTDHYSIRARGWLPCEDNPSDRAKFSLRLTYPEGNEAIASGMQQKVRTAGVPAGFQTQARTSAAEIPPYMFAIVVGPLARVPEAGDARIVDHFVYRQDVAKAKAELRHHAEWIQAMEKAFGPYPYGKYTTVQCPTRWGGFEAPGNVQLAEGLFDAPKRGQGTLAHELVHMWFGDAVGYDTWREVWLSEGFASYFGPWLHAKTGGPPLNESMQKLRTRWAKSFEGRTKSIRDDRFAHPDQALNANTYPKGAWLLHMLRGEVGDEAFFGILSSYSREFRGRSIVTKDLRRMIGDTLKVDLDWFFEQWLDRIGCPELKVEARGQEIVIQQMQKGAPYRFWLRLRWQDGDGKRVDKRVRVEEATTRLSFDGLGAELQVDPDIELLFRAK